MPQSNLSQSLLTGMAASGIKNSVGETLVNELSNTLVAGLNVSKTVSGVITTALCDPMLLTKSSTDSLEEFFIKVCDYNPRMPSNLYVLCGDESLESLVDWLGQEKGNKMGPRRAPPYFTVQTVLRSVMRMLPNVFERDVYGFIDTNPALTAYTQIAICASTKLVIPTLEDEFSAVALTTLMRRVYGAPGTAIPPAMQQLVEDSFEYKLKTPPFNTPNHPYEIPLPKIHMVITNKCSWAPKGKLLGGVDNMSWERSSRIMEDACYDLGWNKVPHCFGERGVGTAHRFSHTAYRASTGAAQMAR